VVISSATRSQGSCLCRRALSSNGGTNSTLPPNAAGTVIRRIATVSPQLIWHLASPKWKFDAATFERSAAFLNNPDHVDIVIHNYRWRLGLAEGESKYDDLEKRLAEGPVVTVPSIALEGDANGAPHAEPSSYASKFSGKYESRIVKGGVGHNLPQEAPRDFAQAILDVDGYS